MTYYDFVIKGKINTYSEDDAMDILDSILRDTGLSDVKIDVLGGSEMVMQ